MIGILFCFYNVKIDQATVSLVAKAEMRRLVGVINDNLRGWMKVEAAKQLAEASVEAQRIGLEAQRNQSVHKCFLDALIFYSYQSLFLCDSYLYVTS